MSLLALSEELPGCSAPAAPVDDRDLYRLMALRYFDCCRKTPASKRCLVAARVAAEQLGFAVDDLRVRSRRRKIALPRQKAMAFVRVITGASHKEVGAIFDRSLATCFDAEKKFGYAITQAIRELPYESRK